MKVSWPWILIPFTLMAVTFLVGSFFTLHLPNAHLDEFKSAIKHGEILLMVDVPLRQVKPLEDFIHHQHPEAVVGGVGWTIEAMHL